MTRFLAGDDHIPATVFGTRSKSSGALGLLIHGVGVAFICRARAKVLATPARPSACRDVPAAEAWPPSSELGQTAPRMIATIVSRCELLLVPSRSFVSGLLLVPSRSFVPSGVGTISLGCFHLLSWPWFACRDCCGVYAESFER